MSIRYFISRIFLLMGILPVSHQLAAAQSPAHDTIPVYPIRLITLDPGHFHAALVQKSMYADVDPVVHVYAPGGAELKEHLALIEKYNTRAQDPADWKEVVYEGADYEQAMLKERTGNVVVLAGNNRHKMDYISACVEAGFNVLSDKPMIIRPKDLAALEKAFADAKKNKVVLYDIMTERYQITTILQRTLSLVPEVFGRLEKGTKDNPAVTKESVHHFFKYVSGKPLTRPEWYFDVEQQGEGIVDVTTHLVDLIQWECFPEQALDYRKDIEMLAARRWPTLLTPAQYSLVTGKGVYPSFLQKYVADSLLTVYANGEMDYTIRGIHARVSVRWNFQAPEGTGDTHYSMMRGELASLVIRQGKEQQYKPVLYIEPVHASAGYAAVLEKEIAKLQDLYPGLALKKTDAGWQVMIPDKYSLDHEATFAEVTKKYLRYVKEGRLPVWEVPDMLAKYYTTMKALELALADKGGH